MKLVFIFVAFAILLMIITFIRDNKIESKSLLVSICLLFVVSVIGIFCRDENLEIALLIFIIGYTFLGIATYLIYSCISCNKKIKAIFIGVNKHPNAIGKSLNFPIYKYEFLGINYKEQSLQDIKSKVFNNYVMGEEYEIYINPKNPKLCIANKKIRIIDFFMFMVGFVFTSMSVILIIDYLL